MHLGDDGLDLWPATGTSMDTGADSGCGRGRRVNLSFGVVDERFQSLGVDSSGASSLRQDEVEDEQGLESVVKGEPVDYADQLFDEGQRTENDPVSEPLSIIPTVWGFKGFEREIGGKGPTE